MKDLRQMVAVAVIGIVAIAMWVGPFRDRYSLIVSPDSAIVFKLDKWTGRTWRSAAGGWVELRDVK